MKDVSPLFARVLAAVKQRPRPKQMEATPAEVAQYARDIDKRGVCDCRSDSVFYGLRPLSIMGVKILRDTGEPWLITERRVERPQTIFII